MRYYFLSLFFFLLFSCTSDKVSESIDNTYVQDSIAEYEVKLAFSADTSLYFQFINNKEKYQYAFYQNNECKDDSLTSENYRKYGDSNPFNVVKSENSDSIFVGFDFISHCCQIFCSNIEEDKNVFILSFRQCNSGACACHCKYSYRFSIPKEIALNKKLVLNGKEI